MNQIDMLVKDAILKLKPKYVTAPVLLSVLDQESDLSPFFSKTDSQYKQNMRVASGALSLPESKVLEMVTLSDGNIAKFRLEPGYFFSKKYEKISPLKRFYWASSWGLGQKMACFGLLDKVPQYQWESTIKSFAGNLEAQVAKACLDFDTCMVRAFASPAIKDKSFKNLAFRGYLCYNAGSPTSSNKDALKRAQEVVNRL